MQPVNAALQLELDKAHDKAIDDPTGLINLVEWYEPSYVPGVNGFDPADAVETFAAQTITWNGIAYRRSIFSVGDVNRSMGEKTNSTSFQFSNIDRYPATLAQSRTIEGLYCVVRTIAPSVTDDSLTRFVGRNDKPGDVDKKSFPLTARQDFGNINQEIPPRLFTADDPDGRTPSDPLYKGFRILSLTGSFSIPVTTASTGFFGRLFGKKKTTMQSQQWSSLDETPFGSVVPIHFGRVQVEGIPIFFADIGFHLIGVWALGEGRVDSITNTTVRDSRFLLQTERKAYGDPGGTGTNNFAINPSDYPAGRINHGYLSNTAYSVLSMYGSAGDVVDDVPVVTWLVRGVRIPVPNASGVFASSAWSDDAVPIARFLLTDSRLVGINSGFMEDAVNYQTHLHCIEPLIDDSNGEISLVTTTDQPQGGTNIRRFRSTGVFTPRYILYNYLGDATIIPEEVDNDYTGFDITDIPTAFSISRLLRRRYVINVPITERVRAVDFLYKTIFPAAKLFLRVNKKGKYEIRSEKSSDATHLRAATAVGATSILVNDVTPWKTGPDLLIGRLLTGFGLITSEVRNVSSATYTADGNSITLSASDTGGITASASGANLSGGSTTVQASGTVTISGTPGPGDTATITIDGIESTHTLNDDDTTGTVAAMLSAYINANLKLNKYIKSTWSSASPTIVTIKSKQGVLNLDSQLLKAHTGPIADPSTVPVLASSAGALTAGTYEVAYSDVTALGHTALSPSDSINLAGSNKIDVGAIALPAGVVSRNWYVSDAPNSPYLKYVSNQNGSAFSINALPLPGAALPPSFNTTGEELLRVAMSFATNSQDVYPAWKPLTAVLVGDVHLPTVLNGHKYDVSAITTGITDAAEPVWPTTPGGTVVNGGVTFREIGSTVLQQAGLTRANVLANTFKWPLGSKQSSVNQIKGSYRDANNDFALTPFKVNDRAHQAQVGKIYPYEVDLSAVDNWHQVYRIASWLLAKFREGDWFCSLGAGPQALVLEEGDLICVSDDSGGLVNVVCRIEDLTIKADHTVQINQARKYSTNMFSDDVEADVIPVPTTLRYKQTVDSIIEFIDNYPTSDSEGTVPGFKVAVSRDLSILGDWRGWKLYVDYGDGYVAIPDAHGDIPAIVGEATDTLDTVTDATVFDTVSEVTFTLKYGPPPPFPAPFVTVTEADLIANPRKNLFLIGDEYVQAATVVDNGSLSYTISDFYRGRFETDGTELVHGASERVVYLDGSEVFVPTDVSRIGIEYPYKVVTTNQNVSEADVKLFTWLGKLLAEKKPTNPRGARDMSGNWFFAGTGHPRNLPANYKFDVYRASDDVLMRSIPVTAGITTAAVFGDTFGDIVATNNNLATGPEVEFTTAFGTDVLTAVGHNLENSQIVRVRNVGGNLPAPLLPDTNYYPRDIGTLGTDEFKLSLTPGGAAINLTNDGTGTHYIRTAFVLSGARTTQELTGPGSFLEFVLPATDAFPGGSINIGLFESADTAWDVGSNPWTVGVYTLRATIIDVVTGEWSLAFWDVGGEGAGEELFSSLSVGLGSMKIRLTFSGTELRIYKDWVNSSSEPLDASLALVHIVDRAISLVPPADHFPMKAAFYLVTGAVNSDASRVEEVVIGGMDDPSTVYSKVQQDFDSVTDLANVEVDMYGVTVVDGRKVHKEFP